MADLTDEAAARGAVARVREALGPIGVLVNNAGMTSLARPVLGQGAGGDESGTVLGADRRRLAAVARPQPRHAPSW